MLPSGVNFDLKIWGLFTSKAIKTQILYISGEIIAGTDYTIYQYEIKNPVNLDPLSDEEKNLGIWHQNWANNTRSKMPAKIHQNCEFN